MIVYSFFHSSATILFIIFCSMIVYSFSCDDVVHHVMLYDCLFIHSPATMLRIIRLNSSKSISPLPSTSTSDMIFCQTLSSISAPWPSTALISSGEIVPPPSLSKIAKARRSFSWVSRLPLSIEATTHSENSISPFWSKSTSAKIASTSAMASSENAPNALINSSFSILPSPDESSASNAS